MDAIFARLETMLDAIMGIAASLDPMEGLLASLIVMLITVLIANRFLRV